MTDRQDRAASWLAGVAASAEENGRDAYRLAADFDADGDQQAAGKLRDLAGQWLALAGSCRDLASRGTT